MGDSDALVPPAVGLGAGLEDGDRLIDISVDRRYPPHPTRIPYDRRR